MPTSRRAPFLLAALLGAGCSAPVVDDVADASGAMTEGVVLFERVVSGDSPAQTSVSAKFMRIGGAADPELAERIVGARLELPHPGTCMRLPTSAAAEKTAELASLGPIDLIDVGDVVLHVKPASPLPEPGPAMPLGLRAFPDVGDLVSGVFYTSPDAATDLPGGAVYVIDGSGSALVDRFSVEAEAPLAPEQVRVGDAALGDGATLEIGAPATVRWLAGKDDLVYVDVSGASGDAVRCVFKDSGEAVVPGSAMRAARLGPVGSTATLALHRVRRRQFAGAAGVDAGEIRFDLAVIGRATLVPRAR